MSSVNEEGRKSYKVHFLLRGILFYLDENSYVTDDDDDF